MPHSPFSILRRGLSQVRRLGLRLLYYRYLVRPRILKQPPLPCPCDSPLEVHLQVCTRDWLNGHWTLRSLALHVNAPFRLVLLHDGNLDARARASYESCFPGVVVTRRDEIGEAVTSLLAEASPTLLKMWMTGRYFTLPKVVESALLALNDSILHIDPDVLFFDRPTELLEPLPTGIGARWNLPRDKGHADGMFCFTPRLIEETCGLRPPVPFGTGLGRWTPSHMPWQAVENLLSRHQPEDWLIFMLDQTLIALHAAANGWQPLPRERYAIEPVESLEGVVARHYFGKTRDLMYVEGMRFLLKQTFQ